jgi:hypothetical protein
VFLNIPCNFLVVPKIGGWDFEIFMVNQWIKKHVYLIYDSRISNQLQLFQTIPRIVTAECLWGILLSNGITHIGSFFLGNFFRILTIEMDSLNVLTKKSLVMFTNKRIFFVEPNRNLNQIRYEDVSTILWGSNRIPWGSNHDFTMDMEDIPEE